MAFNLFRVRWLDTALLRRRLIISRRLEFRPWGQPSHSGVEPPHSKEFWIRRWLLDHRHFSRDNFELLGDFFRAAAVGGFDPEVINSWRHDHIFTVGIG